MNKRLKTTLAALLLFPGVVFGWGGRLHMDIARAAAKDVPNDMAAWREYADVLSRYSIYPDLWKGDDKAEGDRHYIDLERFTGVPVTNLPADLAACANLPKRKHGNGDGIAPWIIMDVQRKLTGAMASNQWIEATRLAAALAHYVGDVHQPLHTTDRYDGRYDSEGHGYHWRWEEQMPKDFWRSSMLKPAPAQKIDDPWGATLLWIDQSHEKVGTILKMEREAARTNQGDLASAGYYQALWTGTKDVFVSQANAAATDLASLWYTAWIHAGCPAIPPPPEKIPEQSIWNDSAVPPQASVKPFLIGLTTVAVVVVVLSMTRKKPH